MDSTTTKSPSETEVITTPPKSLTFTNGVLKRHHHHPHPHPHPHPRPTSAAVVVYKECLKNHAASLGGLALDGCGEFMPSPTSIPTDPTSLKCAACGCHRNFHRRDPEEGSHIIEYHPQIPLPPPPPPGDGGNQSPNSASPPPISSSYNYPNSSAPHMLLALSTGGLSGPSDNNNNHHPTAIGLSPNGGSRKRIRTKFSQEQKEKMYLFSERLGWKLQKRDEGIVDEFCNEIGVERGVLKVWMHNNKHTFGKRDVHNNNSSSNNNHLSNHHQNQNHHYNNGGSSAHHVHVTATNCSSSS